MNWYGKALIVLCTCLLFKASTLALPSGFTHDPYTAFVNAAGGVPLSDQRYKNLRSAQKRELFWSFFTDDAVGNNLSQTMWTVYGANHTTVADLLDNSGTHSIEHVVPKTKYVYKPLACSDDERLRDIRVRKGADINPFNLMACHRHINTQHRRDLHFDFEGDLIVKKSFANIDSIARQFGGTDKEGEWHVPEATRGDVARAVAYMCILYRLDEYVDVNDGDWRKMSRWMQHDPPSRYEVEYNRWVKSRTTELHAGSRFDQEQNKYVPREGDGISNPFIEYPDLALWCNLKRLLESSFDMDGDVLDAGGPDSLMPPAILPVSRGVIISAVGPNAVGEHYTSLDWVELMNDSSATMKLGSGWALYMFNEGRLDPTIYDLSTFGIELRPLERATVAFSQPNATVYDKKITIELRHNSTIVHSVSYGNNSSPGKVYYAVSM